VLLRLEILIAMVLLHHKEQLGGIAIDEQSFGLVHSLSAPPQKRGDLLEWKSPVGFTKKGMGVKGSILFDLIL
jgi:hypothetical protein